MSVERIGAHVHHLPEVHGGPSLVVEDGEATIVDTGIPGSGEAILAALAELGLEPAAVRRILITHADGDHVGGLAELAAATGARVFAPPHEADVIEGRAPSRRGETNESGRVDERIEPGTTLPFHGGIEVVDTKGHTLGHVAYFLRRDGVLFAGDCVNNMEGLAGSPPRLTANEEQAREAVRTVAALRPAIVCFGHGPSLDGDGAERLAELARGL